MTAKEKAFHLIEEYRINTLMQVMDGSKDIEESNNIWKQCALIAVDEIIKEIKENDYCYLNNIYTPRLHFWQEVKKEIELL